MTPEVLVKLVTFANEQAQRLNTLPKEEQMAAFEGLVRDAAMAWAVWQDQRLPHGVGTILVKGGRDARRMEQRRRIKGNYAAIPCRSRFEAEAVNDAFGDASTKVTCYASAPAEVVQHLRKVILEDATSEADREKAIANGTLNRARIDEGKVSLEEFFSAADVIRGVYPDAGGSAVETLKGLGLKLMAVERPLTGKAASLLFASREDAHYAMRQYGDGASGTH